MLSLDELKKICPKTKTEKLAIYIEPLRQTMIEFEINTPEREAMFLAQVCHESGGFNYVREIASGQAYEGRADLGNTNAGDGVRYKGRGLIQITGRANYKACGDALGLDLIERPELLEQPDNATRSAGWFWNSRRLNVLADKGDFLLVTKRINGGTTGFADRMAYYQRATEVLA
jgi:putative chitinase